MNKTILIAVLFPLLTACAGTGEINLTTQSVISLDGKSFSLESAIAGKPAILNFWASWCPFCATELPSFEKASMDFPQIPVIAINLQENPETVRRYWKNGKFTFPSILDPDAELKGAFNIFTQPTTLFLNAEGEVVERRDGPLSEEEIHMYAERIAPSAKLEAPSTKHQIPKEFQIPNSNILTSETPSFLRNWSKKYGDTVKHTIDLEDILSGGVPKDGIPALTEPRFETMTEAGEWLAQDDIGTVFMHGEKTRFYPFRILTWHEIVNDKIDDLAFMITYCPLCDSAAVYERHGVNGIATFGVSGFLQHSNLVMYDRETDSLWNQITGEAIVGERTGESLELLPSNIIDFKTVSEHYPEAEVLSIRTGYDRDYDRNPYQDYKEGDIIMQVLQ